MSEVRGLGLRRVPGPGETVQIGPTHSDSDANTSQWQPVARSFWLPRRADGLLLRLLVLPVRTGYPQGRSSARPFGSFYRSAS